MASNKNKLLATNQANLLLADLIGCFNKPILKSDVFVSCWTLLQAVVNQL